jgi:hypothetical protein
VQDAVVVKLVEAAGWQVTLSGLLGRNLQVADSCVCSMGALRVGTARRQVGMSGKEQL